MFEQEIDLVRKHILEQLFSSQQYIYIHEILNNPTLDDAYKTFFNAEVSWWIYEEQALRHSNPRFDIDAPEIRQALADLDTKYRSVARFDHEELTATVDAAAKARLNFLCRPRTALKWFVFRGEPTKPLHEILLRLDFFSDHRYITDGFKEWSKQRRIDRQPMEILSVVEFERIIERIDNEAIFDLSPQQFVELLTPVFSYFQVQSTRIPSATIPTEALIIFLDDKGVVPISQTLENLLYNDELRYITKERFLEIVDNIVQDMDAEQNILPDATLPIEFDAIRPAQAGSSFSIKEVAVTAENISVPAELLKESPEAEIRPEDATMPESLPEENTVEVALETADDEHEVAVASDADESHDEADVLKEDAPTPEVSPEEVFKNEETDEYATDVLKEDAPTPEVSPEEVFKNEGTDENAVEILKEFPENTHEFVDENSDENTDEIVKPVATADETGEVESVVQEEIATEEFLKTDDVPGEPVVPENDESPDEEPHDSFLEDIHRFKNAGTVIEFDGSLPEEIIEQSVLQENFDPVEISETEKHKQELAEENAAKLPSISQFIDARHIEKFTKKLFKRDNVEYVRFLKELEAIPQWKEAARRIDRHLAQNGIEPDSSIAKEFRELVHKRYGK